MIINQAQLFLIFTLNGVLIGLLFDTFRILRRSFKTKDFITYIEDILFWILTGLLLLYSIFTFSNGEIRLYMFMGVLVGCILYMLLISNHFIKINVKIMLVLKKIIGKIIAILIFPLKVIFKPINFITINMKKFSIKEYKKIKKSIKTQKSKLHTQNLQKN